MGGPHTEITTKQQQAEREFDRQFAELLAPTRRRGFAAAGALIALVIFVSPLKAHADAVPSACAAVTPAGPTFPGGATGEGVGR